MSLVSKQTRYGEQLQLEKDFMVKDVLVALLLEQIPNSLVTSKPINRSP